MFKRETKKLRGRGDKNEGTARRSGGEEAAEVAELCPKKKISLYTIIPGIIARACSRA